MLYFQELESSYTFVWLCRYLYVGVGFCSLFKTWFVIFGHTYFIFLILFSFCGLRVIEDCLGGRCQLYWDILVSAWYFPFFLVNLKKKKKKKKKKKNSLIFFFFFWLALDTLPSTVHWHLQSHLHLCLYNLYKMNYCISHIFREENTAADNLLRLAFRHHKTICGIWHLILFVFLCIGIWLIYLTIGSTEYSLSWISFFSPLGFSNSCFNEAWLDSFFAFMAIVFIFTFIFGTL